MNVNEAGRRGLKESVLQTLLVLPETFLGSRAAFFSLKWHAHVDQIW